MERKILVGDQSMKKKVEQGERLVGGLNTVMHCHHYNSRIQKTIENSRVIDGSQIFRKAAEAVFYKQLKNLTEKFSQTDEILLCSNELYSYLGFGKLNFDQFRVGRITSDSSHFVNGWNVGLQQSQRNVCSFTEGYLAAVGRILKGSHVKVTETQCMALGHNQCVFEVEQPDSPALEYSVISHKGNAKKNLMPSPVSTNRVDLKKIREAVFSIPLFGNNEGLIPAFNVYLAHMPKDFYNIVSLLFVNEMKKNGMEDLAITLLEQDAETCAMNTFAGIMNSDEWMALIQPMVDSEEDNLFGLLGVANALGWGVIELSHIDSWESMVLQSINGYEAESLVVDGVNLQSKCPMLSGVASGLMALVFGDGSYDSRMGTFSTAEKSCLSVGDPYCSFKTLSISKIRESA